MKLRLLLLSALALLMAACSAAPAAAPTAAPAPTSAPAAPASEPTSAPAAAAGGPITVVDQGGVSHTFDTPPTRVICYYNACYGMLATLGVKPVAQAINGEMLTDPIYFDGQGSDIPALRRDGDAIDLESVAEANPDLVIVYSAEEAQALEGIAPAFMEYDPADMDGVYEALRNYGKLLGREAEAEAAIADFQARLAAYAERAPKDVSVLKLGTYSPESFALSTRNDPICQILSQVAICDWPDPTGATDTWSYEGTIESILAADPDVIILNNWTEWGTTALEDSGLIATLGENPLWQELKAVQSGRVLNTPGYNNPIASSLPAATKFLDTYMPLLYPDTFPAPLTDDEVRAIAGS